MKGVAEALSAIIMTGVLVGVVGSVYFWGLPLVQKNKDLSTLQESERFMNDLAKSIVDVVNSPGRQSMRINVPGTLKFDGRKFELTVSTDGTIYSTEGPVPLRRNDCASDTGTWGVQEYATLCATSENDGKNYKTVYSLKFIQLDTEGIDSHKVEFSGRADERGEGHTLIIENKGASVETVTTPDGQKKIQKVTINVQMS